MDHNMVHSQVLEADLGLNGYTDNVTGNLLIVTQHSVHYLNRYCSVTPKITKFMAQDGAGDGIVKRKKK